MSAELERAQAEGLEPNARRMLRFFGYRPGDYVELQAFGVRSGRYSENRVAHAASTDESIRLLAEAETWNLTAAYVIANVIDAGATTRVQSRGRWTQSEKGHSTTDADVTHRTVLYLDFDAVRTKGTSATDEEMRATYPVAQAVRDRLVEILGDDSAIGDGHSGNGRALFVALDRLPVSAESDEIVKEIVAAVSLRWSTPNVAIDTVVTDRKRLEPAFGTTKRKGAAGIAERPHRRTAFVCHDRVARIDLETLRRLRDGLVNDLDAEQRAKFNGTFKRAPKPSATAAREPPQASHPTDGDDVFKRANAQPIADVLSRLGLLNGDGHPICPGCGSDDQGVAILENNGLKCSHARCAEKGVRRGFYTPIDAVREKIGGKPIEAVRTIGEWFGFEVPKLAKKKRSAVHTAPDADADWRGQILTTKTGSPLKIVANAITVLTNAAEWQGVLGYDEMREAIVKLSPAPWHAFDAAPDAEPGEFTEADTTRLCAWLSRSYGVHVSPSTAMEAAHVVAQRRRVHPVRDYLESLRWDGVVRLPTMLTRYAGAPDDAYTRAVSTKMLIAPVARTYDPGAKVDTVPVLEGKQGSGKSSFVRELCPDPSWFFDSDLAIGDKDAAQALRGKLIVELGEMSALSRADRGALKAFVTRQVDTYRPSFGRIARDFPRRWIPIGTTNEDRYLRDATGNRRWLPVRTGKIDLAALRSDRDQLWAEARVRYQGKEAWHVDSAEFARLAAEQQEDRFAADPWEQAIGAWLEPQRARIIKDGGITTASILSGALNIEAGRWTRADEMRCGEVLVRIGWEKGPQKRIGGARVRPYLPPVHQVVTADVTEVEATETPRNQAKSQPSQLSQPVTAHTKESVMHASAHGAEERSQNSPSMQIGSDGCDGRDTDAFDPDAFDPEAA